MSKVTVQFLLIVILYVQFVLRYLIVLLHLRTTIDSVCMEGSTPCILHCHTRYIVILVYVLYSYSIIVIVNYVRQTRPLLK